jgi:SAM-dependent methyltransferase
MSFEALKARQSEAWGSAPWEPMAARLAALHDHLVARLAPGRGERWLDVGTGTGAVALRAARAGARVTGVDLSPVMIEEARRLAGEQGVGVRFEVGDAERLPYEEASFPDFASILRALRPTSALIGLFGSAEPKRWVSTRFGTQSPRNPGRFSRAGQCVAVSVGSGCGSRAASRDPT